MYFATYFNRQNQNCQDILKEWEMEEGRLMDHRPFTKSLVEKEKSVNDFKHYKQLIKKSEEGDSSRLIKILNQKQIFCVPWLVCPTYLFITNI